MRGRLTRDYYRWREDPTTKAGKAAVAWITLMVIMLIVVSAVWSVGAKDGA